MSCRVAAEAATHRAKCGAWRLREKKQITHCVRDDNVVVARFALDGTVFSVGDAGRGEPRPYKFSERTVVTANTEKTPAGRQRYRD